MKSKGWFSAIWALGFIASTLGQVGAAASDAATATAVVPAAQPAAPPSSEPEPDYAFGTVKSVNGDQLVINEFDYDTGEEKEAVYGLDSKTEYDNVASAKEIAAGDEVDIDYLVKEGKKTAVAVSVAKPVEGEESTD